MTHTERARRRQFVIAALQGGDDIADVAKRFRIGVGYVRSIGRSAGMVVPLAERRSKLLSDLREHGDPKKAAKEYGLGVKYVREIARDNDIPLVPIPKRIVEATCVAIYDVIAMLQRGSTNTEIARAQGTSYASVMRIRRKCLDAGIQNIPHADGRKKKNRKGKR